eukprot:jgi/Orpsp1_1/1174909/evm.model.c7180000051919.1
MKANVLPKQFFQLPNLITLNIENSNISEIPSDINTDSPIQEIIINNCKLKEFPHFLTKLQYLKELQLNNNEMTGILNKQFKEFPKIENIEINNNKLEGKLYIPPKIKHFKANNNNFTELEKDSPTSTLQELDLANNDFDENIFKILPQYTDLKKLNLNNNKNIKKILPNIRNLKQIESLDLSGLSIEELPSNIFKLSKLKMINIRNNPKLNAKIINFDNDLPVNSCDFTETNILCYQPNSCSNIQNDEYNTCSAEVIKEIINSQTEVSEELNDDINYPLIIIGIISGVIIIIIFFVYRNKHNSKDKNKENKNVDIIISERITVLPNDEMDIENREIILDQQNDIEQTQRVIDNYITENNYYQIQHPREVIYNAFPVESSSSSDNDDSEYDYSSGVHNHSVVYNRNIRSRNSTKRITEVEREEMLPPPPLVLNEETDESPLPTYNELTNENNIEDIRPFFDKKNLILMKKFNNSLL